MTIRENRLLKTASGEILLIGEQIPGSSLDFMHSRCVTRGHKLQWGPICRNMKRPPKGREKVAIECRTCGDYIELIQIEPKGQ